VVVADDDRDVVAVELTDADTDDDALEDAVEEAEDVALDDALLVAVVLRLVDAELDTLVVAVVDALVVALDVAVLVAVVCVHSRNVPWRYFSIASFINATVLAQSSIFAITYPSIVQFAVPCDAATAPRPVVP